MLKTTRSINSQLLGRKVVIVKNQLEEDVEFEIQKINVEIFASKGDATMENIYGKKPEDFQKGIIENNKKKELSEIMTPAILEGVVSPKISNKSLEECDLEVEIPIKILFNDMILASNLYIEILKNSSPQEK